MGDQAGPFAGLTLQDQKLIMGAFKSLKNGFEVDYSKLAENMDWFMKDDATKPNTRKANNAWLGTRKKLFPDGFPASAAPEAGAAKAKVPATPRMKKNQDAPKTPRAKKTPAKEGEAEAQKLEEGANGPEEDQSDAPDQTAAPEAVKDSDAAAEEIVEANVKEPDQISATQEKVADADEDASMKNSSAEVTVEDNPTTAATGASVADDMSTGSMSPPSASTTAKAGPITPKGKVAWKNNTTTGTGSGAQAANVPLPASPATPTPKVTPKKRKTKAEKEAEAANADAQNGAAGHTDGKPPAKKRKSIDGKAVVKNEDNNDVMDADSDEGESAKPTPVKTPRKPSEAQLAKRKEKEEEKAAKKAEKEKEKADKEREKAEKKVEKEREKEREKAAKKAEKGREKAEKQAAKKGGQKPATEAEDAKAESSKPKTPRKPASANPAKTVEKVEADKAKKELAEVARIALAAQEEINKQANDIFNGARIDKPASTTAAEEDTNEDVNEDTIAVTNDQPPKTNGFIAINGNGNGRRATSVAVAENMKTTVEEGDEGDTIVVAQEDAVAAEINGEGGTIAIGGDA